MADIAPFTWSVVIPVKVLTQAKSRLARLGGERRAGLALAMAADTVTAVLACREAARVIVITDDRVVDDALRELGAEVIPDPPSGGASADPSGGGLNGALRHGAAFARERWPESGLAALFADLPAVRPAEVAAALSAARQWPTAFVADAAGDGTTLYTARPGADFQPSFGLASRARHAAGGAVELGLPGINGLRRDVDTPEDLQEAAAIGLGPHTAGLLRCAPRGR
jgi:2-phospho-L-lactate/phosphoenolpyruvate guanylyltransferase